MRRVEPKIFLAGSVILGISVVGTIFIMPSEFRNGIYPKIDQYNEKLEVINERIRQIDERVDTTNAKVRELGLLLEEFIDKYKTIYNRTGRLEEQSVIRKRPDSETTPDFLGTRFRLPTRNK